MDDKYTIKEPQFVKTNAEMRQILLDSQPHRILSVSIDCAKNVHQFMGVTGKEKVLQKPTPVETTRTGYEQFRDWLRARIASMRFDVIIVANEPTGVYHEAWMYQLLRDFGEEMGEAARVRVIYRWQSPSAVKLERRQKYHRGRKSDVIDLWCIHALNLRGEGQTPIVQMAGTFEMQQAVGEWQQLRRTQRQHQNQILTQLERLWPGALGNLKAFRRAWPQLDAPLLLVQSKPLQRDRVRILIEEDPNPHRIQRMSAAEIIALFKRRGGRCGVKTAERIERVFDQMVLPPDPLAQIVARRVQDEYATFRQREAQIAHLMEEKIVGLVDQSDAAVLLSVPGTSPALVARYIACLRDYRRFPSAAHIWSYAGFDPMRSQSGNHNRTYQISKQGDAFLRDTLFQLGYQMASHCPPVQACFVKAIERGMSVRAAIIHAARKANRILFSLLNSQRPFVNPLSAEKSAFWLAEYQRVHPKTRRLTP